MEDDEGDDERFPARRRGPPYSSWPFQDIDEIIDEMEKAFAEQFKELERELPKSMVRETKSPDGTTKKEIGPIVYGYSVTVGPDGRPTVREFGNVRRGENTPWKEVQGRREPLVDVVPSDRDIRVIAELPGVRKEDVKVTAEAKSLDISVDTEERKYYKHLVLPRLVDPTSARSTYNNGILEVTLPLKAPGTSGVHLKVE